MFNLLNVLDGKIINEAGYLVDTRERRGVSIALPQQNENLPVSAARTPSSSCGEQPEMARRAIEHATSTA